jgi:hypothetical protein
MNDDELKSALDSWKAPEPPQGLAEQAWARFEEHRRPLWIRALAFRVSLPLPAAAAAVLLLLALGAASSAAFRPRSETRIMIPPPVAPATVVREKAATQTVPTVAGFLPLPEIRPQVIRRN